MVLNVLKALHKLGVRKSHLAHPSVRFFAQLCSRHGMIPLKSLIGAPLDVSFDMRLPGASFEYHVTPDDLLGARLFWQDWQRWEPYVVPQFARFVRNSRRIVDIGAHTGIYSLFACALNSSCEVFAFEPFPPIYARLAENIRLNGFESRIRSFQAAVSDADGTGSLHIAPDVTMCALADSSGELEVPLVTLDGIIPMDGATGLVKIDVEGHENRVLRGMARLLEDSHPAIIFECNPGAPGAEIDQWLRQRGYQIFSLVHSVVEEISELRPERFEFGNHNFLATHLSHSG
jgi:FkbM family methyltransferase